MKKSALLFVLFTFLSIIMCFGCSSKQKTGGKGMTSVVAQNVVRIAGIQAMKGADFSAMKNKKVYVKLSGFKEEFSASFIKSLVESSIEKNGALLAQKTDAELILTAVINSSGNDQGTSRVPIISSSKRCEGTVNLQLITRDAVTNEKLFSQNILGEAKYKETEVLGIQGEGKYYVKIDGKYHKIEDPINYQ